MLGQAKALMKLRKIQSQLAKEVVEVEAGDGAVRVQITGEQKIKRVMIDPTAVSDVEQLERWVESAVKQAISRSQELAADKLKSIAGGLNLPGL